MEKKMEDEDSRAFLSSLPFFVPSSSPFRDDDVRKRRKVIESGEGREGNTGTKEWKRGRWIQRERRERGKRERERRERKLLPSLTQPLLFKSERERIVPFPSPSFVAFPFLTHFLSRRKSLFLSR